MKKKVLSILLTVAMTASLLAGCGSAGSGAANSGAADAGAADSAAADARCHAHRRR